MPAQSDPLLPRQFPGGWLRRLRPSDLASFQAYRSIPDVGRYQGWLPMCEAEASSFLSGMETIPLFQPGRWVQLGIAEVQTDALLGDMGLHVSADGQTGEVGVTLAPHAQGRGLATAAVREALQLLFAATPVAAIRGVTDARNERSTRLLERLGFAYREARRVVFRGEACVEQVFIIARKAKLLTASAHAN